VSAWSRRDDAGHARGAVRVPVEEWDAAATACLDLAVKNERPQFDTFAGQHIDGSGRVFERRVGGEACPIRGRIVAFDQDRFVRLHLRYVEPAVGGVVSDAVDLAGKTVTATGIEISTRLKLLTLFSQ